MEHIYQPIGSLEILLRTGERLVKNDETMLSLKKLEGELNQLRGLVINYSYDIERSLKDTIICFFCDSPERVDRLDKFDLSSIILKGLDFSKKISVFEECAKLLNQDLGSLINDLTFIRKRRNRFAHEPFVAIPINEGLGGYSSIFLKNETETIINTQFINEYMNRCQNTINHLAGIRSVYEN